MPDVLKTYTVAAVYADNLQRYGDTVKAYDPIEAEEIARANTDSELLVAGVIEGEHVFVDAPYCNGTNGEACRTPVAVNGRPANIFGQEKLSVPEG